MIKSILYNTINNIYTNQIILNKKGKYIYYKMTELKHIFVEELLNALDDIQRDVPFILDYYMDTEFDAEDSIHMDIDLLAMNITSLRDSAIFTRDTVCTGIESPAQCNATDVTHNSKPASGGSEFSVSDTIRVNTELAPHPVSISPQVKQLALAMFLHTHMLTDPESIYNSGIIGNKDLFDDECSSCKDLV